MIIKRSLGGGGGGGGLVNSGQEVTNAGDKCGIF